MKTFRFFGMMLMAVFFAFSFIACGDDDEDDQPVSLVGTKWYSANDVNGKILSYTIVCFNQGGVLDMEHLITDNGKWYKGHSHSYSYSVNGNQVTITMNDVTRTETWDGKSCPIPGFSLLEGEVLQLYNNALPDNER